MNCVEDLAICAGCLATEVRMCSMSTSRLLEPYRQLSGVQQNTLDLQELPDKLCWECAALVNKFMNFRRKCETSQSLLKEVFTKQKEVTTAINTVKLKRKLHNLCSQYCIFTADVISIEPIKPLLKLKKQKKSAHRNSIEKSAENNATSDNISDLCSSENKANCELGSFVKVEVEVKEEQECDDVKSETYDVEPFGSTFTNVPSSISDTSMKIRRKTRPRKTKPRSKSSKKLIKVGATDFGMIEESLTQEQQRQVIQERQSTDTYITSQYQCHLCHRSFSKEEAYNNHKLLHDLVSGDIECDVCHMRYKTRRQLSKHIAGHHAKRYTCRACNQVFYNRCMAQKHHAWHKGVVYTCDKCGVTFQKRTSHQNHLRLKHPSEHVCGACALTFVSEKGLKQHYQLMHARQSSHANGSAGGPYCETCCVQFSSQQAWTRHLHISPKHAHERHLAPHGCNLCGETFADAASLQKHRSEHKNKKLLLKNGDSIGVITCEQCGEPQADSRAYHSHFRREHPGKTRTYYPSKHMRSPFMCELCGKVFADKIHLKLHSYKHTGERPYKCATCGKRFATPDVLKIHIRTHTKERPYKCDVCGMGFSNGANMKRHKIKHSDAKPYPCDTCGKMFKYRSTVKSHVEFVHMKRPWPKRDRSKRSAPRIDITTKQQHSTN